VAHARCGSSGRARPDPARGPHLPPQESLDHLYRRGLTASRQALGWRGSSQPRACVGKALTSVCRRAPPCDVDTAASGADRSRRRSSADAPRRVVPSAGRAAPPTPHPPPHRRPCSPRHRDDRSDCPTGQPSQRMVWPGHIDLSGWQANPRTIAFGGYRRVAATDVGGSSPEHRRGAALLPVNGAQRGARPAATAATVSAAGPATRERRSRLARETVPASPIGLGELILRATRSCLDDPARAATPTAQLPRPARGG
jgi:hypothetical protein